MLAFADLPNHRRQLLTGATGSLGTHLLSQLVLLPNEVVMKIICLVRADDDLTARKRIKEALSSRDLESAFLDRERVVVFAAKMDEDRLGLKQEEFERLVQEVDVVIHVSTLFSLLKDPRAALER